MLHITNGDSTRMGLEQSGLPGTFVSWPDILYEGPTPLTSSREEWRRVRTAYLASDGYATEPALSADYARGDAALASWPAHDETVFWFEHDLYDQLLLIHHLAFLKGSGAQGGAGAHPRLTIVCGDTYLGPLKPSEFRPLFDRRADITAGQLERGARAWEAFCAPDPMGLLAWTADDPNLPYLAGAIRRHLEEFPAAANGLARSESQILQVLHDGDRTPEQAFVQASRLEERIFMGDSSFWTIVSRLASARHPLVEASVVPREDRLPEGTLRLTATGRQVLAGRDDHVALNGIDRWLGGARLTSERFWRWTGDRLKPAARGAS